VSVGIEYALFGKDTIGCDKVLDACRIDSGGGRRRLRGSGTKSRSNAKATVAIAKRAG
jgi:hypothetical protein